MGLRWMTGLIAGILLCSGAAPGWAQGVRITEFMAANNTTLADEDGEFSDWIELHNESGAGVSLAGWTLTDNAAQPAKWTLPGVVLAAGQYVVIFASDKNRAVAGAELHTNFKLSAGGEYLGLFGPGGGAAEDEYAPAFPTQFDDVSYGRAGSETGYFQTPTPGAANGTANPGLVADTTFSVDRGFHTSPFSLTIGSQTPGAQIRYTLDGSEPTPTNGAVYSAPIPIDKSTVVRARAFFSDWLPSDTDTQTYIFPNSVFTQPAMPSGFPATWGGPPAANELITGDYEMDPEVTGDLAYSGQLNPALMSLPAISVVMSVDDWFDPATGIYSNGSLEGPEWERAGSVEMFLPDNTTLFAVRTGIQIQGGSSTEPDWKMPKLSMRLLFQDQYGPSKLNYRMFEDSDVEEFDTLVLDARSNQTWLHPWDLSQRIFAQYTRDAYVSDLQLATGNLSVHNRYAHLFLNGLYWGICAIHERPDDNFLAAYRGGDSENYDVMRHFANEVVAGSDTDYQAMMSLARSGIANNEEAYRTLIEQYLNLPAYIDYMLINYWVGNMDWARHNWYVGGDIAGGRLFEYYPWDAEHVLRNIGDNALGDNRPGSPTELFHLLKQNDTFRMAFVDRAYELMANGGLLTEESAWALYDRRADEIDPAVILESARWGDHRRDLNPDVGPYDLYTYNDYWVPEYERLRDDYFPQRTEIVLGQFRGAGIYPAIDPPTIALNGAASQGGIAQPGDAITLANPNGAGVIYYTLDGSDPRGTGPEPGVEETTLVAESATKRVLVPSAGNSGSGLGLSWTGGSEPFDDGGWMAGAGGVGYDTDPTYDPYIEIDVEAPMRTINGSCFVRVPFALTQGQLDSLDRLRLKLRYEDGFVAWINGVEVARDRFAGTPQWNSLASGGRADSQAVVPWTFDVSGQAGALRAGSNVLAVQALNVSLTSSDLLMSAELAGVTVEGGGQVYTGAIEFNGPVRLKTRALANGEWSALNQAVFQLAEPGDSLRVGQLMYHPPDPPAGHADAEYILLQNIGDDPVLLGGVRFAEGIQFTFPDAILEAGATVYIVKDQNRFIQIYGYHTNVIGEFESGSLSNSGERLTLVDKAGATIQDFEFSDWYAATDGGGAALEIIDVEDPDLGNWSLPGSWRAVSPEIVPVTRVGRWSGYE